MSTQSGGLGRCRPQSDGLLCLPGGEPLKALHQLRCLDGNGHTQILWTVRELPVSYITYRYGFPLSATIVGHAQIEKEGWTGRELAESKLYLDRLFHLAHLSRI